MKSPFVPWINALLAVAVGLGLVLAGVTLVNTVHAARTAELRVCEAKLQMHLARAPLSRKWVRPADPCVALRMFENS